MGARPLNGSDNHNDEVMRWLWLAAAVLLIAAAVSVYAAFQRPDFVAGLTAAAAGALWKAVAPSILKRMAPEEEAAWRKRVSRGEPDQPPRGHRER